MADNQTLPKETKPVPEEGRALDTTVFDLAIRLALLGLVIFFALTIIRPFFAITLWGVVLAVALNPIFNALAKLLGGRRRLAAVILTVFCLLIVLGPVTWLALDLVEVLRAAYVRVDSGELTIPPPNERVRSWPLFGEELFQFWHLAYSNLKAAIVQMAPHLKPLAPSLLGAAGSAGTGLIEIIVAVLLGGVLLVPGPSLVASVSQIAHRVSKQGEELVQLAGATIRNVCQGVIGVSLFQTLLAGIGMAVAGVPGASLLAVFVLILGIIQIGPALVIIPVVLWSWFSMDTTTAALFTLYMIPVSLVDNVLKPIIMSRGLRTPALVILVGVIGGTVSSGIIGLFVGPIVLAVAWDLLVVWIGERPAN